MTVEALAHEHRNTFLAGEHVDQLELDAPVAVAVAHCLDVADRGIPPPSIAGERRAPRDVDDDALGEEVEGGVPVAALGRSEISQS